MFLWSTESLLANQFEERLTFSLLVGLVHEHTVDLFDEVTRQFDVHVLLSNPETQTPCEDIKGRRRRGCRPTRDSPGEAVLDVIQEAL